MRSHCAAHDATISTFSFDRLTIANLATMLDPLGGPAVVCYRVRKLARLDPKQVSDRFCNLLEVCRHQQATIKTLGFGHE
eukprot:m.71926 g.71926  ORF g.71926 m.71926 type:complete len:80 (-) comp10088_c0_seq2:761-1000(-)